MSKILKVLSFPFKMLMYGLIYFYKIFISPFLPKTCRFVPTCSTYAILAIKEFGVIKGLFLAFKRILRCNPKSKTYGVDPVPTNIKGDVKWLI